MIKPNSAFFGSMQVRKNAKRIMCERGNLLRLIGASFILIAVSDVLIYLFEAVCYFFFDKMPTPLFAAELLICDEDILDAKNSSAFQIARALRVPGELVDFKCTIMKARGYDIRVPHFSDSRFLKENI